MGTRTTDVWRAVSDALLGKPELGGSDAAAMAGVAAEDSRRFWQALGFAAVPSGEKAFTRRDVEVMQLVATHFGRGDEAAREDLLSMARASGQALSRVAHMHVRTVAAEVELLATSARLANTEVADRIAAVAEDLVAGHEPFLGYIWRRHLLAAITRIVAGAEAADGAAPGDGAVVGFADLVDFTAKSQQLTESELADLVDRFEKIVYQVIPDRDGRVVKFLGDEVMFVHASPPSAAGTALALAAACREDGDLPDVRVGLASGAMLEWEGDLYGPVVNLAHRLVGVARPGTVIASSDLAERLADDDRYALVEIRDVKLKGIGRTKPWVLRHGAAA